MPNNYYSELSKIDVGKHIEKKGKFSYLSWAYAVDTLKKHHPDATWRVIRHEGMPYIKTELGYFVEVEVTVNDITHSQIHPVLDNNNRPIGQPNAFQINTSIQRALVKAIALHGLGLYIYAGEDLPGFDEESDVNPPQPTAREKAIAQAKERQKREALAREVPDTNTSSAVNVEPVTDNLPFEANSEDSSGGEVVEPINEGQIKAIGNMLKLVEKKKQGFSGETFIQNQLERFGKSALEELTFEQGKTLIPLINAEMRN